MMDLSSEVRGEEVWVNLAEILSFIMCGTEEFLKEHGDCNSKEFNSGFIMCVKGMVEAFAEFGLSRVELDKLKTVEDFMELTNG
jgi:hypothetical protein